MSGKGVLEAAGDNLDGTRRLLIRQRPKLYGFQILGTVERGRGDLALKGIFEKL